jgi:hypothetical protein
MTGAAIVELKDIDPDDILEVLCKVEKSFGFKFEATELEKVPTFGVLCDLIISKVGGSDTGGCTTQQAFYKLRNAISRTLQVDKSIISKDSILAAYFQRPQRRKNIASMESELGFKIDVLRPKNWIRKLFILTHLISIVVLFTNWKLGLTGLLFSFIGQGLACRYGKELEQQTLGDLAKKISRENYLDSRRNFPTINKNEITLKVKELFSKDLSLDESFLTRDACFN